MSSGGLHGCAHVLDGLALEIVRIEETEMLCPRHVDEDLQSKFRGSIQEPDRGRIIDADHVGVELPNLLEISSGLVTGAKRPAFGIRREGAISDPLDVKLLSARAEKLPIQSYALG